MHNRLILIHKTGITLWLQSKTSVRNMLADLLQMWSLTRTHGESAINHMLRFEHYKVQGRQPLSSRSELIKKRQREGGREKRKRTSVPVSSIVFKHIALKDIIHPSPHFISRSVCLLFGSFCSDTDDSSREKCSPSAVPLPRRDQDRNVLVRHLCRSA